VRVFYQTKKALEHLKRLAQNFYCFLKIKQNYLNHLIEWGTRILPHGRQNLLFPFVFLNNDTRALSAYIVPSCVTENVVNWTYVLCFFFSLFMFFFFFTAKFSHFLDQKFCKKIFFSRNCFFHCLRSYLLLLQIFGEKYFFLKKRVVKKLQNCTVGKAFFKIKTKCPTLLRK
jgi:hypothetical protein